MNTNATTATNVELERLMTNATEIVNKNFSLAETIDDVHDVNTLVKYRLSAGMEKMRQSGLFTTSELDEMQSHCDAIMSSAFQAALNNKRIEARMAFEF